MRKSLALIISLLLLSALMYGCGCDNGVPDDNRGTDMPFESPGMTPLPSPDTDNGIVNDSDGYIEDAQREKDAKGSASDKKSDMEQDTLLNPAPSPDTQP